MKIFCLLILFLFLASPCRAQPVGETPSPLRGVWSSPDCTIADKVWIFSRHFFIHTAPGNLSAGTIPAWREEDDQGDAYYHLEIADDVEALLTLTNDGLVRMIRTPVAAGRPLAAEWESRKEENIDEYSHCAKLFDSRPALGQIEVNSIFLLDYAVKNCTGTTAENFSRDESCQKILFRLVDANEDNTLDRNELIRVYQQMEFLQAGQKFCPSARIFYPSGSKQAASFADALLSQGQSLNFTDLQKLFREGTIDIADMPLSVLKTFLPFLPGPDFGCETGVAQFSPATIAPDP